MVAVLLLIFFPAIALANPVYQSSSNRNSNPSAVGSQSVQYQPASYQMTNTSNYQMSTTLNPAQTVYPPFSDENPSSNNSLGTIGGETASQKERKDGFITPSNPGEPTPLGDAWSLLIFAALAAGVIYIKRRKRTEVRD
jgi:hypothetical protein